MQNDLDFLKLTELAPLFDFPLDSNPLLLPSHIRWEKVATMTQKVTIENRTLLTCLEESIKQQTVSTIR